jgi:hypothetical protein
MLVMESLDILESEQRGRLPVGQSAVKVAALQKADGILEEKERQGDFGDALNKLLDQGTVLGKKLP